MRVFQGETAWSRFGSKVQGGRLTAEALKAAGLDWTVSKTALYERDASGQFVLVPGIYGMQRSDTGASFADVAVGKRYTPVQNSRLLSLGDDLSAVGGVMWEQVGAAFEGRRVWALGRAPGAFETRPGDVKLPYILAYNSHDGSSNVEGAFLTVRPWCWNAIKAAVRQGLPGAFKLRHTASVEERLQEASMAMRDLYRAFEVEKQEALRRESMRMDLNEFINFATELLNIDGDEEGRSKTMAVRKVSDLSLLFSNGIGNRGETREDALQAVVEWIDHQHNRAHRARAAGLTIGGFESAMFGNGARVKERARQLLSR